MKPGDIIFWEDNTYGLHRFYRIEGCFYGGLNETSLIQIVCLNERPGSDGDTTHHTMYVPEPLLRNVPIYELRKRN